MSTKSNARLSPDGILSPSPFHFRKHLQNLAYGSLPSIGLSGWHLKPISDSLLSNQQSRVYRTTHSPAKSLTSPNGIYKPIPASSTDGECKFSGVLECSIIFYLQVTKGKTYQSNPSSTRRLNRGSCHTPKFALDPLQTFHTSILKDSSRVDQTNSLLGNQPKLGFGISQIQMDFQLLQWFSCFLICFKYSPCQVSSLTSQVSSDSCSDG